MKKILIEIAYGVCFVAAAVAACFTDDILTIILIGIGSYCFSFAVKEWLSFVFLKKKSLFLNMVRQMKHASAKNRTINILILAVPMLIWTLLLILAARIV